jgi:hypothetical protein
MALRLVFRPWPPHASNLVRSLLPPSSSVSAANLYSILPSTSRLCHRPSSS